MMGFQDDMETSQEELLETSQAPGLRKARHHAFVFVAALLALCATISFWHYPGVSAKFNPGSSIELVEDLNVVTDEIDCTKLPYVMLEKLISSNLAKQGPDSDAEEGLVYSAKLLNFDTNVTAEVHLHTLSSFDVAEEDNNSYDKDYKPAWTHGDYMNGICGKFACINLKPGASVKLRAIVLDTSTHEAIPIPHGVISFFDLDEGPKSVEHIVVTGFKQYYVSNETELNVTKDGEFTRFSATTQGTGDDNPKHPLELTKLQKNRAVTIEYQDVHHFDFEVGTTAGNSGRVFTFVFRPSLLCAKTKMPDGTLLPAMGEEAPIIPMTEIQVPQSAASKKLPVACWMFACMVVLLQFLM